MTQDLKPFSGFFSMIQAFLISSILLSIACVLIGCGGSAELRYVKDLCSTESVVGYRKGIEANLGARKKQLDSLKVSIGFEKYKTLSQKLEGYNAAWENLNKDTERACRDWAICQYRNRATSSSDVCNEARDRMEERQEAARKFLIEIQKLEFDSKNPNSKSAQSQSTIDSQNANYLPNDSTNQRLNSIPASGETENVDHKNGNPRKNSDKDMDVVTLTITTEDYEAGAVITVKSDGSVILMASTTPEKVVRLTVPRKFLGKQIDIEVGGVGHYPKTKSIVLARDTIVSFGGLELNFDPE